jgi:hypothetical protein
LRVTSRRGELSSKKIPERCEPRRQEQVIAHTFDQCDTGPVSRIPPEVHRLVEWEVAVAYAHGYQAALRDIAAGHVELDESWHPAGRREHERRVAERLAEMERCARRIRSELGRVRRQRGDWPPVAVPGRRRRALAA